MKFSIILVLTAMSQLVHAQEALPLFLKGHWRVEGSKNFEQWDVVSNSSMKGFGYSLSDNTPVISEYLDIKIENGRPILIATVLGQNNGKAVEFQGSMTNDNSQIQFENFDHDFPQQITYTYSKDSLERLNVRIYGKGKESFLKMSRLNSPDKKGIEVDQELAEKLGADDYGMKSYYFVVLKTGPEKNKNKEFVNEAFSGHMANINRLVKEEKLIVAGPFGKNNDQFRGLFILNNVKTEEEAKEILETDPAIKSGLLSYTIYPWYGSAALPMYLPYSEKVTKTKF